MKVKNISPTIVTLRCKKGKDVLKPAESKVIMKDNEEFAKVLIEEEKLKEVVAKRTTSVTDK